MSVVITLKFPLENGTNSLTMRPPRVRDQLAADKTPGGDGDKEIMMFANLCEVTPNEISDLYMSDYRQLQKVFKDFLS
jgi:hypothetical protein